MAKLVVTHLLAVVLVCYFSTYGLQVLGTPTESSSITVGEDGLFIPDRDHWYKLFTKYPEAIRIFNKEKLYRDGCPATFFYLDCNICRCTRKGALPYFCTMKLCIPDQKQIVGWKAGDECPAGQVFYHKCNNCTCNASGEEATCTTWTCPPAPEYSWLPPNLVKKESSS